MLSQDSGAECLPGHLREESLLAGRQHIIHGLDTELTVRVHIGQRFERVVTHVGAIIGHDMAKQAERALDIRRRAGTEG